ncbi:hypothetical protein GOBAR_DD08282 [Gossypium barbadense]|nr:hypothetical protein GOBAR_DD08282 [Gossypium barbadense]
MSLIDPDASHVEYPEILSAHRLAVDSDPEELFLARASKSAKGYNWRVRAVFIQKSQMREIRKFVRPHTCTLTRMTEDHRKLDSKTICTCIMPMVKDMPTIKVSVLIAEMQVGYLDAKNGSTTSQPDEVSLNVEQFFDDVYTLERTFRVWENEFPVLLDLSTWEMPSTTFELM